jgi:mono/diheme cytochrome c family protein
MNQAGVSPLLLRRKRIGWWAVAVTMAVCRPDTPLAAQQSDSTKAFADSVAERQEEIAAGRKVFQGKGSCFACHGAKLQGTAIAPTLRSHKWRNGDGSLGMILRVLHDGVRNTAMLSRPGNISPTELHQVATYVWAVSRGAVEP